MPTSQTMLLQEDTILAFLKMLNGANMQAKANGYADYFNSVDELQKQLNDILSGVQDMRKQLDEISDNKNPVKRAFAAVFEKIEKNISAAQKQLNLLKEKLIKAAKNSIRAFKEQGVIALAQSLQFLNVKQDLKDVIATSNNVIESCNKAYQKIEAISNEYHAMGLSTRNFGRAVIGKEAIQEQKAKGKIAKISQSFVKFRKTISSGMKRKCENALSKLENLEQTAQSTRFRTNERKIAKKFSLMERIENHKKDVAEQKSPDKSNKREEVI